jgi:glycosyltransferase involved in cell wall biosynthesis
MNTDRSTEGSFQGPAPLAILMISLNEAHNMEAVLENVAGFAQEVFVVDSFSSDATVDIALRHGAHVVQRPFRGFGDQWNYATNGLPITAPWTMKLDPDERLTDELKASIREMIERGHNDGAYITRRLWFMGRPLPVRQDILRLWRTGCCRFSDVLVNEHPIVKGYCTVLRGDLEHHDSPNLHHWFEKQNNYTTAEALAAWRDDPLSARPRLFGGSLERRMWLKRLAQRSTLAPSLMFFYCLLVQGAWRAGVTGWIWAKLRGEVLRWRQYKAREIELTGRSYAPQPGRLGAPDPRVAQVE